MVSGSRKASYTAKAVALYSALQTKYAATGKYGTTVYSALGVQDRATVNDMIVEGQINGWHVPRGLITTLDLK